MSSTPISSRRPAGPRWTATRWSSAPAPRRPAWTATTPPPCSACRRSNVRIVPTATGGGFGAKLDISVQPLIGLVALKTGRPAALAYTRAESMMSTTKRHPGLDARHASAPTPAAASSEWSSTASSTPAPMPAGARRWRRACRSTPPAPTPRRTIAHAGTCHPHQRPGLRRLPRLRRAAGDDHAGDALRRARRPARPRPAGVPSRQRASQRIRDGLRPAPGARRRHRRLPGGAAAALGAALADAAAFNAAHDGVRRGVGIASCWYGCGNTSLPNPSTIKIGLTPDGAIVLHQGAVDIGQGSNTVIAQIAADALGLPLVGLRAQSPEIPRSHARLPARPRPRARPSSAAAPPRPPAARCARRCCASPTCRTAPCSTLAPGRLVIRDGDAARGLDLSALPRDADGYVFAATESYDPPTAPLDAKGQGSPYAVYGYGAQIVELEVDLALGTVRLVRRSPPPTMSAAPSTRCSPRARSRAASRRASAWR